MKNLNGFEDNVDLVWRSEGRLSSGEKEVENGGKREDVRRRGG